MDRSLKERLIGAVALVAIAVLVVPVFLDGPSNETAVVIESVTLPGQNEQTRKRQTIVLERDREQPVPVPAGQTSSATPAAASNPVAETEAPDKDPPPKVAPAEATNPEPAARESAPPPQETQERQVAPERTASASDAQAAAKSGTPAIAGPESATGMWAVQLGSFSSQENAERLAAELRKNGYAAFLSQHKTASGSLHRVRIGPQKDRASAETVASKLSGSGHKGQVVPHP
jgi:DedD protein